MLGATHKEQESESRAWKLRCKQSWLQLNLYARNCEEETQVAESEKVQRNIARINTKSQRKRGRAKQGK